MKIVHVPFSKRNPYQKLLGEALSKRGVTIRGETIYHLLNVSFLNLTIFYVILKYWKPDIIHLHWQSSFLYIEGSRLKTIIKAYLFIIQLSFAKALGIKIIWTAHNLRRHEKAYRDIEKRFTKKLAKIADKIIAHCKTAKIEIQCQLNIKNGERVSIVPHGHFLNHYPNDITRKAARRKLNLEPANVTFLFLGELRYYKGVVALIDTFKSLKTQDAQLIIAGRPHDRTIYNEIKRKTKNIKNIKMNYAYVPDKEMQVYIHASDIMIFPYQDIFTSGGIFLALSFGKPIIAPKMGCIADTLGDSSNYLYNPLIDSGLSSAMKRSMTDIDQFGKIGKSNLAIAEAHQWKDIADKTLQLYYACLEKKRASV